MLRLATNTKVRRVLPVVAQCLFAIVAIYSLGLGAALGQTSSGSETEVKSAFIYNFTKYVQWPRETFANETAPICIGVLAKDDFAEQLESLLKDKKAQGRGFQVKVVETSAEAARCHVLYVSQSQAKKFTQYADLLCKAPVLTVGESANFLNQGGIVKFFREDSQLRFEINNSAAERSHLVISSKLLRLSTKKGESK